MIAASFLLLLGVGLVQRDLKALSYWRAFQENEDATRARIADWIAWNTSPNAVVAMEAIGYQGALSRRRVVDLAGLVTPARDLGAYHERLRAEGLATIGLDTNTKPPQPRRRMDDMERAVERVRRVWTAARPVA